MAGKDRDESAFFEEMAKLGVEPLRGKGKAKGGAKEATKSRQSRRGRQEQRGAPSPGRAGAGRATPGRPAIDSGTGDVGEIERTATDDERSATDDELVRLRAELEESRAANRDMARQLREMRGERDNLAAANRALRDRCDSLAAAKHKLRELFSAADRELGERAELRAVLEARGLRDDAEAATALALVLDRRPREFLDAIKLSEKRSLTDLLERRLALVAEGIDVELGPDCAILRVSPERCEISGGSDIRVGFRRFVDSCRRARVGRVTIVGGSPAYRKELKRLAQPHGKELRLNLVSGTKRREKKRAEADMRSSDLVVIWGATELDHSVSAVYSGTCRSGDRPLQVGHRGISRMLSTIADWLDRRPAHKT